MTARHPEDGKGPFIVPELAEYWGCSEWAVLKRIRSKKLIATKPVDRWRIEPDDIRRYERAHMNVQPVEKRPRRGRAS